MAKVTLRWLVFQLVRFLVWLLTRLLWLPMRLLETLCEALEDAEIAWLQANANRRIDVRRRLHLVQQIEPLPGTRPAALDGAGHDGR